MSQKIGAPTYRERTLIFNADETIQYPLVGDFITFLTVSGSLQMSIDEGPVSDIRQGITFKMPEGEHFEMLRFSEIAGAAANVLFVVSRGVVFDSRASISGNVSVQNAASPNDELQVETKAGTTLTVVQSSNDDGRKGWADLSGATIGILQNSTTATTLVTAGANTSGIRLFYAAYQGSNGQVGNYLTIGGTPIIGNDHASGQIYTSNPNRVENLLLPSGQALIAKVSNAAYSMLYAYEVL
jgi:hypothetical protein